MVGVDIELLEYQLDSSLDWRGEVGLSSECSCERYVMENRLETANEADHHMYTSNNIRNL
jgi:predicted metal-dependent TIM-barrel fold hydrolase